VIDIVIMTKEKKSLHIYTLIPNCLMTCNMSIILLGILDTHRLWKRAKLYTGSWSITSIYISAARREATLMVGLDSNRKSLVRIQVLDPITNG